MDEGFAEQVRAMFDAVDAGEFGRLRNFYSEDCVYERPGFGRIAGLNALEQFYREVRIIRSGEHRLTAIVAEGAVAAVAGRFVGTLRDGSATDVLFSDHYVLDDSGRIAMRRSYFFVAAV